jgi:hypothetical protein
MIWEDSNRKKRTKANLESKDRNSWFQTFTVFCMLYVFFWVIIRRLNFICRRFGTPRLFHLHRQVGVKWLNLRIVGVANGRNFDSKIAWAYSTEGDGVGVGPVTEQVVEAIFEPNLLPLATTTILKLSHSTPTCLWRWNTQCVPKCWHIKFRRRGITQKKTYNKGKN